MRRTPTSQTLLSIVINIVLPVLVLTRLSGAGALGPKWSLVMALAFPLLYGLAEFRHRHTITIYSVLGVVSVVLTGGIGLLQLSPQVIALKEAAIPFSIALIVLGSLAVKKSLLASIFESVIPRERIYPLLEKNGQVTAYERRVKRATYLFASSFLFSAVLNYVLARMIVVSEPGTEAFNVELGRLTALSYPIIALPSLLIMIVAFYYVLKGLADYTGIDIATFLKVK